MNTVVNRVKLCRLIEKVDNNKKNAQSVGIKNISKYKGKK